jgi:hypothetical protein
VPATAGLKFVQAGLPSLYIAPGTVAVDATLTVTPVEAPALPGGLRAVGPAFDVSLGEVELAGPVEIALPLDPAATGAMQGRVAVATYLDGGGWTVLPSWLSEDHREVHAIIHHLSPFQPVLCLLGMCPEISAAVATPAQYENAGWPPCFDQDLVVRVDADDPDGEIAQVQVMFSFRTAGSEALYGLTMFVTAINGLGLVITAGDITAGWPAAQTAFELTQSASKPIAVTEWAAMGEDPGQPGSYYASLPMGQFSTCEGYFDVDSTMAGTGVQEIIAGIRVTDDGGLSKETSISIPVYAFRQTRILLEQPGPTLGDVRGPIPAFSWAYLELDTENCEAQLAYAEGEGLWERWLGWGVHREDLSCWDTEWAPPESAPLSPGEYSWGIELTNRNWLGDATVIQSAVWRFTVDEVAPSPTPSPTPTETPSPTPTATPSPTPTEAPSPTPTAIPSPTRTAIPSPTPTAIPSPTPTATRSPTPTATRNPTPTQSPTVAPQSWQVGSDLTGLYIQIEGSPKKDYIYLGPALLPPVCSPDGRTIAFGCKATNQFGWEVCLVDSDGGNLRALTSGTKISTEPQWLPDGSGLLVASYRQESTDIWQIRFQDNAWTNLTPGTAGSHEHYPTLPKAGGQLLFHSDRGGGMAWYIANADGSNVQRLSGSVVVWDQTWFPWRTRTLSQ